MAERAGISRRTLVSVDKGLPSVAMGIYVQVLFVLDLSDDITKVASDDKLGRKLQDSKLMRTKNITEEDNSLDTELALEVAKFFRLKTATAKEAIDNIKRNIKSWRKIATQYGLSKREQDLMSAAFEHL